MTTDTCGHPSCRWFGDKCESCARRRRYGFLVEAIVDQIAMSPMYRSPGGYEHELEMLDALAGVMEDRARLVREHRREMIEEIRAGQRDARDSAHDAYHAGRIKGGGW